MYRNEDGDAPVELESQFVLRVPEEPARILREAINNSSLKDRFSIRIENDLRHGEVRVDHHLMNAKIVDLPTIIESLKSIDGKSFYKTADICQILICKEGEDQTTDEETQQKTKRKDPNKVDKKYLWPHGITPPTKNVRKRRFRKTLRKKYAEAPEIEKEVKRLIRSDNDAVGIKWEVINEDDDNRVNKGTVVIKKEPLESNSQNVGEHDIFGSALSDSEEEDAHLNVLDMDDNSADSRLTDSSSMMNTSGDNKLLTEFSSDMFIGMQNTHVMDYYHSQPSVTYSSKPLSKNAIEQRLDELDIDLAELKARRQEQELKIETIENIALRQRFQDILERILQEQLNKEQEQYELQALLKQAE